MLSLSSSFVLLPPPPFWHFGGLQLSPSAHQERFRFPLTVLPLPSQKLELDQWAAEMNAQFEEAEQFNLLVE